MRLLRKGIYRLTYSAAALALTVIGSGNVYATAIPVNGQPPGDPGSGYFSIANASGTLVGVTSVPTPCINWSGATTCSAGVHPDAVTTLSSADFSSGAGTIKDITTTSLPVTAFLTVPGGSNGLGTATFDLISIPDPTAFFPVCNPGGPVQLICATSTFVFVQDSSTQLSVGFTTIQHGYYGTSASGFTNYEGDFKTTISGKLPNGQDATIANVLNFEAGGGTITSTWSASVGPLSGVPEPLTSALLGSGLLGIALLGRRRRRS